jgi:hypothetical protein
MYRQADWVRNSRSSGQSGTVHLSLSLSPTGLPNSVATSTRGSGEPIS